MLSLGIFNHQNIPQTNQFSTQVGLNKRLLQRQKSKQRQIPNTRLIIDPQKVHFSYDSQEKTIVQKIILKNDYPFKITFKLIQPKKNILSVKCKKNSLHPKQILQIFIFLNGQKEKKLIDDQFVISLQKQKVKLHIPIICRPKQFRMSHSRTTIHKKSSLKSVQNFVKQRPKAKKLTLKRTMNNSNDQFGSMGLMINNFMDKYNQIHELVKQKNLKKQIFIGQKALSLQKQKNICSFNQQVQQFIQERLRRKVQSRIIAEFSQQGPVVRNFQGLILRWSKDKNIPKMIYQKGLAKVQQEVRKYLVNLRFQRIYRILSFHIQFENSNEHNNLTERKKQQIYVERLERKLNRKTNPLIAMNFERSTIIPEYFQLQYEVYSQKKINHYFQINPRIGFDNWVVIQQSVPYTHQQMKYTKKQPIHQWLCHPKLNQHKSKKSKMAKMETRFGDNNINSSQKINNNELQQLFQCLSVFNQIDESKNLTQIHPTQNQDYIVPSKQYIVSNNKIHVNTNDKKIQELDTKPFEMNSKRYEIDTKPYQFDKKQCEMDQIIYEKNKKAFSSSNFLSLQQKKVAQYIQGKQSQQQLSKPYNRNPFQKTQQKKIILNNKQIQKNLLNINFNAIYPKNIIFKTYMDQLDNNITSLQQDKQQNQQFIIKELSKYRANLDYFNMFCFSKHQFQSYKQANNKYAVQNIHHYNNNLIRKVPKDDKFQFDRLHDKSLRILAWIQQNQKQEEFKNGKIKAQIQIQVPLKNKIKNYVSSGLFQKNLENLDQLKKNLIGKSQSLQVYFHQSAKNKQNAFIMQ